MNLRTIKGRLNLVRHQDHDHVRGCGRLIHFHHLEAVFDYLSPSPAFLVEADDNLYPGIVEVESVSVSLASIAHNSNSFAFQGRWINVPVVEYLRQFLLSENMNKIRFIIVNARRLYQKRTYRSSFLKIQRPIFLGYCPKFLSFSTRNAFVNAPV